MTDDEYAEWIRSVIQERRHRSDMEDMERRRWEQRERDRKREREEFMEREKEEQRAAKRRRESAKAQEADKRAAENRTAENRKAERRGWRGRCAALMDGEIVSINLKFADIPWPMYTVTGSDDVSASLPRTTLRSITFARSSSPSLPTRPTSIQSRSKTPARRCCVTRFDSSIRTDSSPVCSPVSVRPTATKSRRASSVPVGSSTS